MIFKKGEQLKLTQKLYQKVENKNIDIGVEKIKVEFVEMKPKSRTKCLVKLKERGKGWDESTNSFKGINTKTGWIRGERKDFNQVIECHIKNLK